MKFTLVTQLQVGLALGGTERSVPPQAVIKSPLDALGSGTP